MVGEIFGISQLRSSPGDNVAGVCDPERGGVVVERARDVFGERKQSRRGQGGSESPSGREENERERARVNARSHNQATTHVHRDPRRQ